MTPFSAFVLLNNADAPISIPRFCEQYNFQCQFKSFDLSKVKPPAILVHESDEFTTDVSYAQNSHYLNNMLVELEVRAIIWQD